MSRSKRLATVVRVREIQSRMAEIEAEARRRDVDDRRTALDRSTTELADRAMSTAAGVGSAVDLSARQAVLDAALDAIADRAAELDAAIGRHDDARDDYLAAHRRHDAVERLHDRKHDAEQTEEARRAQVELDDLVSVRHGRDRHAEEDR
ncbi:MAG: flagellar export protein FliJ [Actinomycetota bacterium]